MVRNIFIRILICIFAVVLSLSVLFLLTFAVKKNPYSSIKPLGAYELFRLNDISYYGKHDYAIFCSNDGFVSLSLYKIFDKKSKSVFETNSYDKFFAKLEELFRDKGIQKINFYGTCSSDYGYQSLKYALRSSKSIESYEMENFNERQLVHIKTKNGVNIEIEYLLEDMICTCRGE